MNEYEEFTQEVKQATNEIDLKKAVASERKGIARFRDVSVFAKQAWSEAQSFISPIQSAIIFLGLTTAAIIAANAALRYIAGIFGVTNPFQFPLELAAL